MKDTYIGPYNQETQTLEINVNVLARVPPQAFRAQAKVQHPDKGGNADLFGRLQRSFEVLSDPRKRAVYDTWAKELQFRYVRGVAAKVSVHYTVISLVGELRWG